MYEMGEHRTLLWEYGSGGFTAAARLGTQACLFSCRRLLCPQWLQNTVLPPSLCLPFASYGFPSLPSSHLRPIPTKNSWLLQTTNPPACVVLECVCITVSDAGLTKWNFSFLDLYPQRGRGGLGVGLGWGRGSSSKGAWGRGEGEKASPMKSIAAGRERRVRSWGKRETLSEQACEGGILEGRKEGR